jgi:hypothetical protein
MDNLMVMLGAMKERTHADEATLSRARLQIVRIHSYGLSPRSLIEAELTWKDIEIGSKPHGRKSDSGELPCGKECYSDTHTGQHMLPTCHS